jgi:CubicO group peptidase (beta-lactamase class C family)
MMYKTIPLALFIFLCLNGCSKDNSDRNDKVIEGKIINGITKIPLPDVRVTLLEKGPVKTTDANGEFYFTREEAVSLQSISDADLNVSDENLAVSLTCSGYLPKESNVVYNSNVIIEIVPDTSEIYYYTKPVQLNDGLTTGTLLAENMDTSYIQRLMNKIASKKYKEIHSLLIYRNGKLILEEYYFGNNDTIQFENNIKRDKTPPPIQWSRIQKHYIASVNKSLTSSVVGIALDKLGKSVNDKVSSYLPEYALYFNDTNKNNVTIENCLTMTMGFKWDEWGANDLSLLWKSDDFASFLLSRDNMGPNSEWRYNSASPNLLLRCLDNMVGGSIRNWADKNFYSKLGITDYKWESQPGGLPEGAARMFMRPRDMLKIGSVYLNGGIWNGEQVIPETWVEECFKVKQVTSSGDYSYFFWLRQLNGVDYLSADGDGGNYINIIPSLNMVVVITQGNYLEWPLYVNQADDMMKNYIFKAVH